MAKKLIFLFAAFFCYINLLQAQSYEVKLFNARNKLEGTYIYNILQDSVGYLWLSTEKGIYTYNGLDFKNLENPFTDKLAYATTGCLGKENKEIYFGFSNGKLAKYNGIGLDSLKSNQQISRIEKLKNFENEVYGLTQYEGIFKVQNDTVAFLNLKLPNGIYVLTFDFIDQNTMAVGTNNGLFIFTKSNDSWAFTFKVFESEGKSIKIIKKSKFSNEFWLGVEGEGLYSFSWKNNSYSFYESIHFNDLFQYPITSITEDDKKNLWVGTAANGLIKFRLSNNGLISKESVALTFSKKRELPGDNISCLIEDVEGNVWVGMFGTGLARLTQVKAQFINLYKNYNVGYVSSFLSLKDDFLLIGSDAGLFKGYFGNNKDSLIVNPIQLPNGIELKEISGFTQNSDYIYVGTKTSGIYKCNKSFTEVVPFLPELLYSSITSLTINNNYLWVAVSGNGIWKINTNTTEIEKFNIQTGFIDNDVEKIFFDQNEDVWVGSRQSGLSRILKDGSYEFLSKEGLFNSFEVTEINQDENLNIWVGTEDSGVFKIDANFKIENFSKTQGLLSNYIKGISFDQENNIWLMHQKGLTRISNNYEKINRFSINDGFPMELTYRKSFFLDGIGFFSDFTGNFYLGNDLGFTIIESPVENFKPIKNDVTVVNVRKKLRFVDEYKYTDGSFSKKLEDDKVLEFTHEDNYLTFDFITISLYNVDKIDYSYKLDGFEEEWSPLGKKNIATYNNLSPGKYKFLVNSFSEGYPLESKPLEIPFIIRKPFWKTIWFRMAELGIFTLFIFMTFYTSRSGNARITKLLAFITLFMIFDYLETSSEEYVQGFVGAAPLFQVIFHLMVALLILPIESFIQVRLSKRAKENALKSKGLDENQLKD